MISFVVPAHNEEAGLRPTLAAIHDAMRTVARPYEIIVVDDASTDRTAEIAQTNRATVVPVQHRQIAATRNAGARVARGDFVFFVDADTRVTAGVIQDALAAMERGAAGGGAWTRFADRVPLYAHLVWTWFVIAGHLAGFTGGAFMFCTRAALLAGARFDERLFGAEEWSMALAIKRTGPFAVLWSYPLTSGRRFRQTSPVHFLLVPLKFFRPTTALQRRAAVQKIWYESDRTKDDSAGATLTARLSNGVVLVAMVVLFAPPLWALVALLWPDAMRGPLGTLRQVCGAFTVHAGLVGWPFAFYLWRTLPGQTRWAERVRLALLGALCLGQALYCTWEAAALWRKVWAWL
jgi:hypothetical protein